ncbi:MAG: hypothetical protein ACTSPD_21560 [Promethearchaeota archaeon]
MIREKKLKILYNIFYFSAIGWGITFLFIGLLGGLEGDYPLYIILYPETFLLKVLVMFHCICLIIFLSILLFFNGLTKRPPTLDVKLIIHRKEIYYLIENSKLKKILTYILFFGFSITWAVVIPFLFILNIWFPYFVSPFYPEIRLLYASQYLFGALFLLYLGILFLISYYGKKKEMRTKFIKKSIIKKYLGDRKKASSYRVIIQIIRWLDDEIEKKFNELIGFLPKRSITVPEDLEKLPGFDGNISKTELKKVNNQKSRQTSKQINK